MIRKPEAVAPERANRDNFQHLSGDALRAYAYTMGIARSSAATMTDEKLKQQIRFAISHHYEESAS